MDAQTILKKIIVCCIKYPPKSGTRNFIWNGYKVQSELENYHQMEDFLYVIHILMKAVLKETETDNTCSVMSC